MKRLLLLCGALCASATKRTDEPSFVSRQADGAVSEGVFFRRGYHSSESAIGLFNSHPKQNMLTVPRSRGTEWKGLH